MRQILEKAMNARQIDLEGLETELRAGVLASGARSLTRVLRRVGRGRREEAVACACGARMESEGLKSKVLETILGPVPFERSLFRCPACASVRYPGDEELDIVGTTRSPGLRRMMARAGSQSTFKDGREDLRIYAGVDVSPKDVERVAEGIGQDVERWAAEEQDRVFREGAPLRTQKTIPVLYVSADGTGIPMVPSELEGRKGKQPDGSAKTREVKLGCVFTQTAINAEGYPVRDPESTTFVGAIEPAEEFGRRLYAEAHRRGLWNSDRVVLIGDGADWIRNIRDTHFPMALQIVDLYHAREYATKLAKLTSPGSTARAEQRQSRWWDHLDEGKPEAIILHARNVLPTDKKARKEALQAIGYFENNKDRMRYATYRDEGLFVGSGVIEAGCKTVIGYRLKQSGMEWSVRGANAIIALRCTIRSARLDDYWTARPALQNRSC